MAALHTCHLATEDFLALTLKLLVVAAFGEEFVSAFGQMFGHHGLGVSQSTFLHRIEPFTSPAKSCFSIVRANCLIIASARSMWGTFGSPT